MTRVAKARRLKRQGRIARKLEWLVQFWGPDWLAQRDKYLCTVQPRSAAHCGRILVRNVRKAKARQALRNARERVLAGQTTTAPGTQVTTEPVTQE